MRVAYQSFAHRIDVEAFEQAIDFELIREGVNQRGEAEHIGQCLDPWGLHKHGDTTGKFAIQPDKRVYHCFVCGGGTLLDLTMAIRDCTDEDAEAWLYQFTTAEKTDQDFLSEIDAILYAERAANPPMPYFNEHVLDRFGDFPRLEGWLNDRGITAEIAESAHVGFHGTALRRAPEKAGQPAQEPYSGPCVVLPHYWGARLVGWQQRWLDDDRPRWIPKYTNTSGFPKQETLYGYEDAWSAEQPVIICESTPTVLFLRSIGYPAIGTFGGAISEEQMRLLRYYQQGVVLAPDNDAVGRKWTSLSDTEIKYKKERTVLAEYLVRYVPVKVIEPVGEWDSGNDLADLLLDDKGGLPFARAAVKMLYESAEYF